MKFLKLVSVNLFILLGYLTVVSYFFVSNRYPNPIGAGLLTVVFFSFHLLIFMLWYYFNKMRDKKILFWGIASIVLLFIVYNFLSEYHYRFLWYLRGA